jgi:C1A family cysteine protease
VLVNMGAVEESVWPYVAGQFAENPPAAVATAERFRIANYQRVHGLPEIRRALNENPPVVAGFTVFSEMMSAEVVKKGIIPLPTKASAIVGGLAVVIVGYDDKAKLLKFANSWGANWGDKGFGYLPYDYVTDDRVEAWTFTLPRTPG